MSNGANDSSSPLGERIAVLENTMERLELETNRRLAEGAKTFHEIREAQKEMVEHFDVKFTSLSSEVKAISMAVHGKRMDMKEWIQLVTFIILIVGVLLTVLKVMK